MAKSIARIIILFLFFSFPLFPIFWIISFSFKEEVDITGYPPKFVFKPTLYNYIANFTGKERAATGVFPA